MIVEEKNAEKFNCHYPDATHCVGSRCMAWRWAVEGNPKENGAWWFSTTHGYCGLAGRP